MQKAIAQPSSRQLERSRSGPARRSLSNVSQSRLPFGHVRSNQSFALASSAVPARRCSNASHFSASRGPSATLLEGNKENAPSARAGGVQLVAKLAHRRTEKAALKAQSKQIKCMNSAGINC